jgi:carboxylesterase type B
MVFIYGGGFETGTTSTYDGAKLASLQDVVVVIPA